MNYLNYLKSLSPFSGYIVTDELNYQFNGEQTACIVKYLNGTNYVDSKVQPIQLVIYTKDSQATKSELETFTKTYNNVPSTYDNGDGTVDYFQQIYSTPNMMMAFDPTGNNYTHQYNINLTLLISSNVSDITQVKIDNVVYETTQRTLSYFAQADNQRVANAELNETHISYASIKFNCNLINKNKNLQNKIKQIRLGQISIDTTFTIVLTFTDASTETYNMKLDNVTLSSENQTLPILSLSFTK